MNNFRTIDRQTSFLLPPSVDDWLPQKHLARFVVELIDNLDVSAMSGAYRGSGSALIFASIGSSCCLPPTRLDHVGGDHQQTALGDDGRRCFSIAGLLV